MVTKWAANRIMKREMMRYCMIWNLPFEASKAYFAQRGFKLSNTQFVTMRREVESDTATKEWFTRQAMKAMESDHRMTVDQYSELERILLREIEQLAMTSVYLPGTDKNDVTVNEAHDTVKLTTAIRAFDQVKKSKSDVLMANPVVQAILLKHQQDMEQVKQLQLVDVKADGVRK